MNVRNEAESHASISACNKPCVTEACKLLVPFRGIPVCGWSWPPSSAHFGAPKFQGSRVPRFHPELLNDSTTGT